MLAFLLQNIAPPPAPPLKAQTSPLANMFTKENDATSAPSAPSKSIGIINICVVALRLSRQGVKCSSTVSSIPQKSYTRMKVSSF